MRYFFVLILWLGCCISNVDSQTTETDRFTDEIEAQIAQLNQRSKTLPKEFVSAIAIMNRVQSRLSSLNYAVRKRQGKPVPTTTEECLSLQAGICGNHIAAFLEVADRIQLRARPVEFYIAGSSPLTNSSHICVEVYYDQQWHLFDVTWGTYFMYQGRVATIDQIRQSASKSRAWAVTNESDLWYLQWKDAGHDPLVYVDHAQVDILRGRNGTIHLRAENQIYKPVHQPNFVGRNSKNKDYGAIQLRLLTTAAGSEAVELEILGKAGNGTLVLTTAKQQTRIPMSTLTNGTNLIKLSQPTAEEPLTISIAVDPLIGVGYVVFSSIQLKTD